MVIVGDCWYVALWGFAMDSNDINKTGVRARVPRLLLVDDEPMLQFTLRLMLEDFFEVVLADSGDQARAAIEADPRFDVVLSDLQMPGGSGQDLHGWVAEAHPTLLDGFVFMTGGACSDAARQFLARPGVVSIEKPFEFDELLRVVTGAISARAGRVASA
jgi:DNA-binding NtrC family response regulator